MSDTYAMRRANGDWFVLEADRRLRVPLFQSSHDATMARLRNFGMLLFQPVALNARLLSQIVAFGGGRGVDFFHGDRLRFPASSPVSSLKLSEIEMIMNSPVKPASPTAKGNDLRNHRITAPQHDEWWN